MEKWAIRADPSSRDPDRCLLLVNGTMQDITAILKKFAALCGRPQSIETDDGYNFRLSLHKLDSANRDKLTAFLESLETKSAAVAPRPAPPIKEERRPEEPPKQKTAGESARILDLVRGNSPDKQNKPMLAAPAGLPWAEPIDPRYNLDSVLVGPYNRFAHAAAASVVGSPGSLYNPLLLHGAPGTGKTHFLRAIAASLEQTLGPGSVLLTSGPRLSKSVSDAAARGAMAEIEKSVSGAKALLVDDFHLTLVSDANREALAKMFARFINEGLQVVLTSLYPPASLAVLEESLKLALSRGWSVDLKVPAPDFQFEILKNIVENQGLKISPEEIKAFHQRLGSRYGEAQLWLKRLGALARFHAKAGASMPMDKLLAILFEEEEGEGESLSRLANPEEVDAARRKSVAAGSPNGLPLAVFVPGKDAGITAWVLSKLQEAGTPGPAAPWRCVATEGYDPAQSLSGLYQIAEAALKAKARAVLIVSSKQSAAADVKPSEFFHAVSHVLSSYGLTCCWIGEALTLSLDPYRKVHLDLSER